jgi:hypothetical protein
MIKPTEESMVKYVKNYGSIYSSADIHYNVEHFNYLLSDWLKRVVLLKLVTDMEKAIVDGDPDPELQLLVERREIAYALWQSSPNRRRGNGFWREFRLISDLAAEKEEFVGGHRISPKFDSSRSWKHLWRNLKNEAIGRQYCSQNAMFSPSEFNLRRLTLDLMRFSITMGFLIALR